MQTVIILLAVVAWSALPLNAAAQSPISPSELWHTPTPEWVEGAAKFYRINLMEEVAFNRGMSLRGYVDGVALMSPSDRGATVWLKHPKGEWEGPFLVVDCTGQEALIHTPEDKIRVVEVGWKTARRWKMRGPIEGVQVSKIPPDKLKGEPLDYRAWMISQLHRLN